MLVLISAVAILGLVIGSFLNVVIHRVPRGESIVRPGSHCPKCGCAVRARHNVPLIGWLLLKGRCADCRNPISARYPLVELATALVFAVVTARVLQLGLLAALPAYLFFAAVGIAVGLIDLDTLRLPDSVVYPSYLVLAALLSIAALLDGQLVPLARAGVAAAALIVVAFALATARPDLFAVGDVKLAGVVGAMLGYLDYATLLVGAAAAVALIALFGTLGRRAANHSARRAVPFAPAMIVGALLALFGSAPLVHTCTRLVQRV